MCRFYAEKLRKVKLEKDEIARTKATGKLPIHNGKQWTAGIERTANRFLPETENQKKADFPQKRA